MVSFMSYFQLGLGLYLLYCGISGKGAIYDDKNIKKDQRPKYRKYMRIFSFVISVLMLAGAAVDFAIFSQDSPGPALNTARTVLWVASMVVLVGIIVLSVRMTDRTKSNDPARHTAPRAAFEFEDEDDQKPSGNGKA